MKHNAEDMIKSKDPQDLLLGLSIYLQSILKFFQCGQLYEDRALQEVPLSEGYNAHLNSALSMLRSTVNMLKYFINHCEKAEKNFLSALGERCLAFCHAKCFRLNATNLRQMHRELTHPKRSSSSNPPGKDRTSKFLTEINDALSLYESIAKMERNTPDLMDPIPQEILSISTDSFINYVKQQLEKNRTDDSMS